MLVFPLMLLSCGQSAQIEKSNAIKTAIEQTKVAAPTSDSQYKSRVTKSPQYKYRVTKSTNLYDSASIDAAYIEELSVGTILDKVGVSLNCVKFEDSGMTFELCKMRNAATGSTGWVLYKWLQTVQ